MNSKRHGKGRLDLAIICNPLEFEYILGLMIYINGRLYEGLWENDLKHGKYGGL